ncbi:MAG: transposase [Planctomycetota bacterium]
MTEERVTLCRDVCVWMESVIPEICDRGGWELLACAVAPDHVHCVLRVRNEVHGRDVRKWFKRWLSDALNERCGKRTWFAKGGSAKAIREPVYFRNAVRYVNDQRASVD